MFGLFKSLSSRSAADKANRFSGVLERGIVAQLVTDKVTVPDGCFGYSLERESDCLYLGHNPGVSLDGRNKRCFVISPAEFMVKFTPDVRAPEAVVEVGFKVRFNTDDIISQSIITLAHQKLSVEQPVITDTDICMKVASWLSSRPLPPCAQAHEIKTFLVSMNSYFQDEYGVEITELTPRVFIPEPTLQESMQLAAVESLPVDDVMVVPPEAVERIAALSSETVIIEDTAEDDAEAVAATETETETESHVASEGISTVDDVESDIEPDSESVSEVEDVTEDTDTDSDTNPESDKTSITVTDIVSVGDDADDAESADEAVIDDNEMAGSTDSVYADVTILTGVFTAAPSFVNRSADVMPAIMAQSAELCQLLEKPQLAEYTVVMDRLWAIEANLSGVSEQKLAALEPELAMLVDAKGSDTVDAIQYLQHELIALIKAQQSSAEMGVTELGINRSAVNSAAQNCTNNIAQNSINNIAQNSTEVSGAAHLPATVQGAEQSYSMQQIQRADQLISEIGLHALGVVQMQLLVLTKTNMGEL